MQRVWEVKEHSGAAHSGENDEEMKKLPPDVSNARWSGL